MNTSLELLLLGHLIGIKIGDARMECQGSLDPLSSTDEELRSILFPSIIYASGGFNFNDVEGLPIEELSSLPN